MVGFILAYVKGFRGYIDAIAVHPKWRGRGVGSRLLVETESRLASLGASTIYLSVKSSNVSALNFYLKNGYSITGVVLLLEAEVREIQAEVEGEVKVRILKRGVECPRAMPVTWWNSITGEADMQVYPRVEWERVITVYEDGRFRGIISLEPETRVALDYLAVSYHEPAKSLRVVLHALKSVLEEWGVERLVVPLDASKHSLLKILVDSGFRVIDVEYKLTKNLNRAIRQVLHNSWYTGKP